MASKWREGDLPDNPYQSLPDHCFWRRSIAGVDQVDVDPVVRAKFEIGRQDRIATAGSCFAQHIARHLARSGFNYFVTETAHPVVAHLAKDYNYGVFTARYGNIYTSRQLIQTLRRAYGLLEPKDVAWTNQSGRAVDPYRPQIQPNGFASGDELVEDRRQHFAAIRRAVEELDIFVFTLGLTETWYHRADGVVYPLCPGVAGGRFEPGIHAFVNLRVGDVISELEQAVEFIRERNPAARFILTVSPVPLIATMEDRSVLVSTTYSKSVLRVAAEEVAARYHQVAYFPSYEIVTGSFNRQRYFAENLRDVTEAGVSHVMRLFMKHYATGEANVLTQETLPTDDRQEASDQMRRELEEVAAVICDEVSLDPGPPRLAKPSALVLVGQEDGLAPNIAVTSVPCSGRASAWDYLRAAPPDPQHQHGSTTSATAAPIQRPARRGMLSKMWRS